MSGTPEIVAVTGACGFIGARLAAELNSRGVHVIALDTLKTSSAANLMRQCLDLGTPFAGELYLEVPRTIEEWRAIFAGRRGKSKGIAHLAAISSTTWPDERELIINNTGHFSAMIEYAAREQCNLVYASSGSVYGIVEKRDKPLSVGVDTPKPVCAYAISKWMMERWHLHSIARLGEGLVSASIGLRLMNVFGPGEAHKGASASMIFQIAKAIARGESVRLYGPDQYERDHVHVHDVVECFIAALGAEPDVSGIYNCGSGKSRTFREVFDIVASQWVTPESGGPRPTFDSWPLPESLAPQYQPWTCANVTSAFMEFGWAPRRVGREAIEVYARSVLGEYR